MRIVCTLNDQKQGRTLSDFLTREGIENQLEVSTNTDWGSPNYGDFICKIWVIDEDKMEAALRWVDEFQHHPDNPVFQNQSTRTLEPLIGASKEQALKLIKVAKRPPQLVDRQPLGTLTLYFLVLCCLLFAICEITAPPYEPVPSWVPPAAVYSAPIKKLLYFDYPHAYELIDKIVSLFGIEKLNTPQELPPEGQRLLNQFKETPHWQGIYDMFLQRLKNPSSFKWNFDAPLFEKIRQGELWRLFSPCVLHNDLLHLFFNMIWLVVLGKQMEQRMDGFKYLLFILITGVVTNIAQYLMSGSNFIGFSGVLCAMLTFIWVRQKRAAWEGYQLQGVTMGFMMFFILTMFLIQVGSFALEIYQKTPISPGIANTAHLTGAVLGYILGHFHFFSWKA